jgi:hypothetical protein
VTALIVIVFAVLGLGAFALERWASGRLHRIRQTRRDGRAPVTLREARGQVPPRRR